VADFWLSEDDCNPVSVVLVLMLQRQSSNLNKMTSHMLDQVRQLRETSENEMGLLLTLNITLFVADCLLQRCLLWNSMASRL